MVNAVLVVVNARDFPVFLHFGLKLIGGVFLLTFSRRRSKKSSKSNYTYKNTNLGLTLGIARISCLSGDASILFPGISSHILNLKLYIGSTHDHFYVFITISKNKWKRGKSINSSPAA